jgi:hypothetical protein
VTSGARRYFIRLKRAVIAAPVATASGKPTLNDDEVAAVVSYVRNS